MKKTSYFLTDVNEHASFHQLFYEVLKHYLTQYYSKHPLYRYLAILGNDEIL